jgi:hypothetical protein
MKYDEIDSNLPEEAKDVAYKAIEDVPPHREFGSFEWHLDSKIGLIQAFNGTVLKVNKEGNEITYLTCKNRRGSMPIVDKD